MNKTQFLDENAFHTEISQLEKELHSCNVEIQSKQNELNKLHNDCKLKENLQNTGAANETNQQEIEALKTECNHLLIVKNELENLKKTKEHILNEWKTVTTLLKIKKNRRDANGTMKKIGTSEVLTLK